MFGKLAAFLFGNGKLANCIRFFGCMVLSIAAITGMAWAHCGLISGKRKRRASGDTVDTRTAKMETDP